jgi:flagellar biosynthesis protein FlhA
MDGASKFVKGDAIAGIVILLINIVGGLSIGMMQRGMRWDEALETYTLLTIGDGIVTQVPALVIAVGTGIIVTRSSSDTNLSREVVRQLTSAPRTLVIVACALAGLVLLPGIPVLPALTVATVAGVVAWFVYLRPPKASTESDDRAGGTPTAIEDPYAALAVEPIEVLVGRDWAPLVGDADSIFMERVSAFRTQQAEELGVVLPRVRFKESARLAPQRYEILIDGAVSGRGDVRLDRMLAIHPAGDQRSIEGEATREPTYGLPALWIDPALRDEASRVSYGPGTSADDRDAYVATYGCVAWTEPALDALARRAPLIEVGSGQGQWARALQTTPLSENGPADIRSKPARAR